MLSPPYADQHELYDHSCRSEYSRRKTDIIRSLRIFVELHSWALQRFQRALAHDLEVHGREILV